MGICFGVQSADRQLGAVTVRASRATSPRTRDSPPPAWGSPASGARAPIHPPCVQPDPRICRHSWLRSAISRLRICSTHSSFSASRRFGHESVGVNSVPKGGHQSPQYSSPPKGQEPRSPFGGLHLLPLPLLTLLLLQLALLLLPL
jgi:hypothetical protein